MSKEKKFIFKRFFPDVRTAAITFLRQTKGFFSAKWKKRGDSDIKVFYLSLLLLLIGQPSFPVKVRLIE